MGDTLYREDLLHKHSLTGRRLELGAGGGLVGLGVALAMEEGPHDNKHGTKLLLTDQKAMMELLEHNIELNSLQDRVEAMVLNWCVSEYLKAGCRFPATF